jgi:hypothetical protein
MTGAIVLLSAELAAAKLPPWTCELSTTRPVTGEPVTIEVRYWWDADHTEPAKMAIFRRLRSLVAVGAVEHGKPGELIPITLPRVSPSAYRGKVTFPDTGRFRIAGCGGGYNRRGYPLRRGVVVAPREAPGAGVSGLAKISLAVGVVVGVGVATVIPIRRRLRPRSR